ncbi:MAG: hypothetical protein AAF481_14030, partial [Acidobacteriota bacterium]
MQRSIGICVVLVLLLAGVGCGPSIEEQAAAALDAQWEELQQAKASLDDKRAELAAAREAAEAAMEEAAEEVEGE